MEVKVAPVAAVALKVVAVLVVFLGVVAPDQNQRLPVETRNIFLFSKCYEILRLSLFALYFFVLHFVKITTI